MPQSLDHSSTEPEPNRPDQPAMPTETPYPLTFSQRYGYEPLPEPMRPEHLSDDLRVELCDAVEKYNQQFEFLEFPPQLPVMPAIGNAIRTIGQVFNGYPNPNSPENIERQKKCYEVEKKRYETKEKYYKKYREKISREVGKFKTLRDNENRDHIYSSIFRKEKFYKVLDLIEIIINESWKIEFISKDKITDFAGEINGLFSKYNATYQLNTSQHPYWFFPRASKEQVEVIQQAIETIRHGGMNGAATHLRKAGQRINEREYADSIRESIHAVKAVARKIDPNNGNSLKKALESLENAGLLKHRALKEAFMKLYNYTSDEKGIRHSLVDQISADVGLDEAIFMFGACASFAAYLTQKHQHLTPKCLPEIQDQQQRQDS